MSDTWSSIYEDFRKVDGPEQVPWLATCLVQALQELSEIRNGRNVIFYTTAFLQQPGARNLIINKEDINGFMSAVNGMNCKKGLSLILHTPGGDVNAAETIMDYLKDKFNNKIETIVPVYAMSAGTMMALSTERIVMGRQSQLGPIDPKHGGISAASVLQQFKKAWNEFKEDRNHALIWQPILQSIGPSLLVDAEKAIKYGRDMVAKWLEEGMLKGNHAQASKVVKFFSPEGIENEPPKDHGQRIEGIENEPLRDHGQRINSKTARKLGLRIESLENSQKLQNIVLKSYHLVTIMFENFGISKLVVNDKGHAWFKKTSPSDIQHK